MSKYLTKSRFKVAYECPAKLFYNERPTIYANKNHDNGFLEALAKGGFQVGALAKIYYPNGIDLEGAATEQAVNQTKELLSQDNVTLFEAAIQNGPFLVRIDILVKRGDEVSLIEVKSKSYDSTETTTFFKKRDPGLSSEWEPYLVDIAFQTWVTQQAYPNWTISSSLFLPDKSKKSTVDGIHQHFLLVSSDLRSAKVKTRPNTAEKHLGERLLKEVLVNKEVTYILNEETFPTGERLPAFATYLASTYQDQTKALARISSNCKSCEFRVDKEFKKQGLKSAFEECWLSAGKLKDNDIDRPMIFDIWNCHKTEELLAKDKVFMDQVNKDELKPKNKSKSKRRLQSHDRQWLQIQKAISRDNSDWKDKDGLRELFATITYPIHCIDFETTAVAIPFHKGRRPYEQIAFQFSHHILHKDGRVAHVDQHLDVRTGMFPNFDFLRKLKSSLSTDQGTIFRYAPHENTVLRQIRDQLQDTPQPDQDDLIAFIDSITKPRDSESGEPGTRNMVDLREVVLDHYYHPMMGGSNSIKKVIPAVIQESSFLRNKYSKPIYGKTCEIPSLNFDQMTWIKIDTNGMVIDPYKRLPPVFQDISQNYFSEDAPLFTDDSIDDGGAAMTAWSRMQFTEMSDSERSAIQLAMLKYCELDTLSMIWLLEYWRSII